MDETDFFPELRSMDGERKGLVYDNYSRLIAAVDTVRDVRSRSLQLKFMNLGTQ